MAELCKDQKAAECVEDGLRGGPLRVTSREIRVSGSWWWQQSGFGLCHRLSSSPRPGRPGREEETTVNVGGGG